MKLDTNGTNPDMIEHLLRQELVDYVAMDVKHDFSKYDSLTGKQMDRAKYQQSIEIIKSIARDYEFRTTLIR